MGDVLKYEKKKILGRGTFGEAWLVVSKVFLTNNKILIHLRSKDSIKHYFFYSSRIPFGLQK